MPTLSPQESDFLQFLLGESEIGAAISEWGVSSQYYVVSLTEEPDLLSQWRAYASKSGYCIGLAASALKRLATMNGFQLRPCVYDENEQRQLIAPVLDSILERWRADPPKVNFNTPFWTPTNNKDAAEYGKLLSLQKEFDRQFSLVATICKNPSFSEEREWRLTSDEQPGGKLPRPEFREGRSLLIPYIFFNVDIAGFSGLEQRIRVVCGPSPELQLSQRSAMDVLSTNGWPSIESQRSLVPYRDW